LSGLRLVRRPEFMVALRLEFESSGSGMGSKILS
jgi:hypothetical protein